MNKYRICIKCPIDHYENCDTCFGFGVYIIDDVTYPISASDAHSEEFRHPVWQCPECGSTIKGVPK